MQLRDELFWCRCADRVIFLDVAQDRYFCLAPQLAGGFLRWSEGEAIDEATLARLVQRNILVPREHRADRLPIPVKPATLDYSDPQNRMATINMFDVGQAILAQLSARITLRHKPLAQNLAVRCRRAQRPLSPSDQDRRAQGIAGAFAITEGLVRSVDQCLPRALAAWRFCAKRAVNAHLIFGVRADPFAAHCWVQLADAVIVGDLEQVRLFTPILAVPCDHVTF